MSFGGCIIQWLTEGRYTDKKRMLKLQHPALKNRWRAIEQEHDSISRRLLNQKDGRRGGGGPKWLRTAQFRENRMHIIDNFPGFHAVPSKRLCRKRGFSTNIIVQHTQTDGRVIWLLSHITGRSHKIQIYHEFRTAALFSGSQEAAIQPRNEC